MSPNEVDHLCQDVSNLLMLRDNGVFSQGLGGLVLGALGIPTQDRAPQVQGVPVQLSPLMETWSRDPRGKSL